MHFVKHKVHPQSCDLPNWDGFHAQVRVVRDGQEARISIYDLLVGDVVLVETGDIIPADGVLLEGADIKWVHAASRVRLCYGAMLGGRRGCGAGGDRGHHSRRRRAA